MQKSIRKATVPALLTLALLATSAWAQEPAASASPATPSSSAPAATHHAKKHEDFVEQRIKDLHSKLKITDKQSQQWDAFAQTMRDNAQKADQAFRDRAQKIESLTADDAMKSYAELAKMHAENMQKLADAFSSLYGVLSDDQKKVADKVFRNEPAKRHHSSHKPKAAAPADAPAAAATPAAPSTN